MANSRNMEIIEIIENIENIEKKLQKHIVKKLLEAWKHLWIRSIGTSGNDQAEIIRINQNNE